MQADFFKADVIPFPLDRSVEVLRMARFLHVVQGERAQSTYHKHCRSLAERLRMAGIPDAEIWRQLQAYQMAVQATLQALLVKKGAQA